MQISKVSQLGWVVAAGLGGILLAGGFQGATEKHGVVDLSKVIEASQFGKSNQESFNQMKAAREGLLEYVDTNRVITREQADKLKVLMLLASPKPEEKAELEKIKKDVQTSKTQSDALLQKPNPTDDDKKQMQEYSDRSKAMADQARQWYGQFTQDMQKWADQQKNLSIDRARAALADVAKAQGFTLVFEVGVVPYGANDLTDAATKAMDARK